MLNLSKEKFFFFDKDVSEIEVKPKSLEHAYLAILSNDLDTARHIFALSDSPRGKWGLVMVSVLEGFLEVYPTYFQIRNFLEIDLDFLIKNEKFDYTEQLLGALDLFVKINQETYKYTARVMSVNKLNTAALNYMEKSRLVNYNDAELHFIFAKYYMDIHDYEKAYDSINICLTLIPDYYPAQVMKQKIEETWI